MSQEEGKITTIKYDGTTYELDAAATAFLKSLTDNGIAQDVAMAALKAASGSGALKKSAQPKEVVPDLAELAQPVVDAACKRNQGLIKDLDAYQAAKDALDALTAAVDGVGDGWQPVKTYTNFFRFEKDIEVDGVRGIAMDVDLDTDISKAGQRVIDQHRAATAGVMAVVKGVAKKEKIDPVPTVGMTIDGRKVVLSQKSSGRRSSSGTRASGGTRANYQEEIDDTGEITIKATIGEEFVDVVVGKGKTADELEESLKEGLPKIGKVFYKSQWTRQDYWPES